MKTNGKAKAAKKPTTEAKVVKTIKAKKAKLNTADLDKKNEAVIVKAVTSSRELKYIYPDNVNDPLARKAWRQVVRAKLENFEKRLITFDGKVSEKKALKEEYNQYKSQVLCSA